MRILVMVVAVAFVVLALTGVIGWLVALPGLLIVVAVGAGYGMRQGPAPVKPTDER